jgi:hypothetical protein
MNLLFFSFLTFLSLLSSSSTNNFNVEGGNAQKKVKRIAFRTFLKNNGLSLDPKIPNKFESLQSNNKYSNHYFNFGTDLPDNWEIDRGYALNTVIRSFSTDTGSQISVIVIPYESTKGHQDFQQNPIKYLDKTFGGSYLKSMKKTILQNITGSPFDFSVSTKRVRSISYAVFSYKYVEVTDNEEVEFTSSQYQTNLWNTIFTFNYSVPSIFYSESTILEVLNKTNYINPNTPISE